jgi:bacterioferritin-associated ferredoxin
MKAPYQEWLEAQLATRDLVMERSEIVSQFVSTFPEATLADIKVIDDEIRSKLYQTHKRFEIDDFILCKCKKVTQNTVKKNLETVKTLEELKLCTTAGTGCGKCIPDLESLLADIKPKALRWHGEAHSVWGERVQASLDLWNKRISKYPPLKVKRFDQGQVVMQVDGSLTSDQEWDLSIELSDYLAEGFPEPLVVFLDFAHS